MRSPRTPDESCDCPTARSSPTSRTRRDPGRWWGRDRDTGGAVTETLRVALGGLSANKLRTTLTVLGLMIGVGSVLVVIAGGNGSSSAVEKQIDALGSNVLLVSSATQISGFGAFGGTSSTNSLTLA